MSFLAPSPPQPVASVPAPAVRNDAEVREAERKERLAARLRQGRRATILTSGAGLAGSAPSARKRLLGE